MSADSPPRCEAEVTHGRANVAWFGQCVRDATTTRVWRTEGATRDRPLCTQHAKAYDRGSLNGFVK